MIKGTNVRPQSVPGVLPLHPQPGAVGVNHSDPLPALRLSSVCWSRTAWGCARSPACMCCPAAPAHTAQDLVSLDLTTSAFT